jgi:hypothetical protein
MTTKKTRFAATALALTALAQTSIAQAQEKCIEQQDVSDGIVYAMPLVTQAFMDKCSGELAPSGFMATRGEDYIAKFQAKQDANWPGALRLLQAFGNSRGKGGDIGELMKTMPEEALRPFVDAMIGTMVAKEIPLKDCKKIERGIALLAPLPPENVGGLASFLFEVSNVKNPNICPYKDPE